MAKFPTGNQLLDSLAPDDLRRLLPHLEEQEVPLAHKETINVPGRPIERLYFPTAGVVSLIASVDEGAAVEVGIIGREGMVGTPVLLGSECASNEAFVQIEGRALRMPTGALLDQFEESRSLRRHLLRFAQALSFQISQSAACNARHVVDERCARWLLAAHDRVGGNELVLTHEFLGIMLGVRRAGVTVAAGALQRAGLIRYRQGQITILDREGLEGASCECYRAIKAEYARLLA
jgi:CRP-like cAMP-binding protein